MSHGRFQDSIPPHVTDPDLLERIRLVEGPLYREDAGYVVDHDTGVSATTRFNTWCAEQHEAYADDPAYLAEKLNAKTPTGIKIYGLGGSTRYYVLGDGSVHFSERHAGPAAIARARAAGFPIFR